MRGIDRRRGTRGFGRMGGPRARDAATRARTRRRARACIGGDVGAVRCARARGRGLARVWGEAARWGARARARMGVWGWWLERTGDGFGVDGGERRRRSRERAQG